MKKNHHFGKSRTKIAYNKAKYSVQQIAIQSKYLYGQTTTYVYRAWLKYRKLEFYKSGSKNLKINKYL